MPYPAVSIDGLLTGPVNFSDWSGWTTAFPAGYQRMVQVHPASTSNPIRPDGTRAMSGYLHHGGRWKSPSNAFGRMTNVASPVYWQEYRGCFPTVNVDPGSLQLWEDGALMSKLKALETWAEREVQFSNALRQSGQLAKMVGDLGKGLSKQIENGLSSGLLKGLAREWKTLPGKYLEYLYGWRPLMDDISNITDRLIDGFDAGNTLHVCLAGKWSGRGEKIVTNFDGGSWGTYFTVETKLLIHQKNRTVMKYAFPADRLPNLEPTGFFGGLYEGAPYSFVLDWISPVGTWLNALDANALAIYFVEGCTSELVKVLETNSQHVGTNPGWKVELYDYEPTFIVKPYKFTRVLEDPWSIKARVPFRTTLNLSHAAQGIALLTQAMKRLY